MNGIIQGMQIQLNKSIAEGCEGILYELNNGYLIKIFKKDVKAKIEKVRAMISFMNSLPTLQKEYLLRHTSWPIDMVFDENRYPIGYVMKKAEGCKLNLLFGEQNAKKQMRNITYKDLFDISINLIETINMIRRIIPNFIIGDISPNNIYVNRNYEICLIDVDSIDFKTSRIHYPCIVSTLGYRAYETILSVQNNQPIFFSQKSDDFVIAMILFSLLTQFHPYANCIGKSYDNCIKEKICPLFIKQQRDKKPVIQLDYEQSLTPNLIQCFSKFFIDGCQNSLVRPTLSELSQHLVIARNSLKPCKHHTYHYYIGSKCPFCEKKVITRQTSTKQNIPNTNQKTYVNYQQKSNPKKYAKFFQMLFLIYAVLVVLYEYEIYFIPGREILIFVIPIIQFVYWKMFKDIITSFGDFVFHILFNLIVNCVMIECFFI